MTQHIKRQSAQARAIALFDAIATAEGLSVGTKTTTRRVLKRIGELTRPNPILMHGKRVEAMFAAVAAALGKCALIREEDVGDLYSVTPVQPPDYRIVLLDGAELLIEVKNCHETRKPLRLKADYVERLSGYGKLLGRQVKLAIYWSRWNAWTLVPLKALTTSAGKAVITFPDAMKSNEMATLGDHMIATTPPLAIRVSADPSKSRKALTEGQFELTIGKVELFCGGRRVDDKLEKSIVNHFMLFGRWPQTTTVEVQNGDLQWFEFVAEPEELTPGQGFSIVGEASAMISRHFDFRTVSMSGEIQRLQPLVAPNKFGIDIPHDYKGRDVPIWRFILQPRTVDEQDG